MSGAYALLIALLVVPLTLLEAPAAHAVSPEDTPFLTWNMQGATSLGQSLWTDYFPGLMNRAPADVVMLQESGAGLPGSAVHLDNPPGNQNPLVSYGRWRQLGGRETYWWMVFLQTHDPLAPGGRVNTVVMARRPVDQILVVDNPLPGTRGRPALGVLLGDNWFFSYHALSGGGGDAAAMLAAIGGAVRDAPPPAGHQYNWTVGGDFNTEPNSLVRRRAYGGIPTPSGGPPNIVSTGQPTHRNSEGHYDRELDYAVTTTGRPEVIQANRINPYLSSDHDPVQFVPRSERSSSSEPQIAAMPAGGFAMDGANISTVPVNGTGMRRPLRNCYVLTLPPCNWGSIKSRAKAAGRAGATGGSGGTFDYVGAVTGGNTSDGDNDEETYPGQSIDQIRQHMVTDLRTYKPNVVLLQLDVANDLASHSGLTTTQEATQLENLLDQIYYDLPNTTVLVGDPAPSRQQSIQDKIYTGDASYIAQSDQIIAAEAGAGHRISKVVLDFEHDVSDLDTGQKADGVPNYDGYKAMTADYGAQLMSLWKDGTIVDPGDVVVNPSDIIVDGSGVDDTAHGGGSTAGRPCDIYDSFSTPCVEAVSTTRALYSDYDGPLYQVQRAADKATKDIRPLAAGGYADAASQDSFCADATCLITKVYDQSPLHNDLTVEGKGSAGDADHPADAATLPVTVNGHKVYGINVTGQVGYRNNSTQGIAKGAEPEGMYMVASGTHVNSGCCFDFGNAETSTTDTGNGHMDAVNLGTECYFPPCTGQGPWVEADLENGLFSGANGSNLANKGNSSNFVTALLKNDGRNTYALKGGDAQSGKLSTWWDGDLPDRGGYKPMQKEGAVVLGTGGDNSNRSIGSFFEGVMTHGYPGDDADDAVQADIVSAGYAGNSAGSELPASAAGQAVVHSGYSSVFSVNAANGHLQETYLPAMNDPWTSQDLSAKYGTPKVMPGTQPVSLVHADYTSVFTIDAGSGHLQETYLTGIGASWITQDLSAKYGTPRSRVTPTAVVHGGYTSLYTVDTNGDLQETYLPVIGSPWVTQDLSAKYGTPQVLAGTSPVSLVHGGYTSVWTVNGGDHHLQETYLPAVGDPWTTQDLSAKYGTPVTTTTPGAVVHDGYASVYTVDGANGHLQETYLPAIGDPWTTQDFTAKYGTPAVRAGTVPAALFHTGYTSVYTVDVNGHLQESYLPRIGDPWTTQDFTAKYGSPATATTPIPLLHPAADGALTWSSVFTFDEFSNHLKESYLPGIGDPWTVQDLSTKYGTPPALVAPVPTHQWSAVHDGYTSVFTVDVKTLHLDETFLDAMGKPWKTQDLTENYHTPRVRYMTTPAVVTHDGYTSVYTVNQDGGDLQETYLPRMGADWVTQNLSKNYHTPAVATVSSPAAVYHDGYTSVYTVNDADGHLQETYLPGIGADWVTQDLSGKYHTPAMQSQTSPAAVVHDGWTSVFTIDAGDDHLQETYLPAVGAPWTTQDLTAKCHTPAANPFNSPTAVVHDGWTSVYTSDANRDLRETYLPAIGDDWTSQNLSEKYQTPKVAPGMPPVALYHTGYTSVYTINDKDHHLQETYLPAIGNDWTTQDLSDKYHTPPAREAPTALVHYDANGGLTWTSVYTVNSDDNHLSETYLSGIGASWITQDFTTTYHTPPAY
ncbi:endonuclease/exonuclease/phosphatase family protein [Streptomyces sp. LP11]|uniref:Endonuclease/exonuclease/phosphatase family protein n=1 Tax=Streptomyces pyxinicus TaxID=2970331 RepID=A0ABT2B4T3_9ACTN|nr:arabinofuranosidase catalytic domain-containing protein [Streptomyces sp. LP11]MCS0603501.1 endonuclease/exonuclease/phosphatase family protein [Streptomyces sp. LP11]